MKKIQKLRIFIKLKSLLINKLFVFKVEERGKRNSLFNISLNEKIEDQHITCNIISMI